MKLGLTDLSNNWPKSHNQQDAESGFKTISEHCERTAQKPVRDRETCRFDARSWHYTAADAFYLVRSQEKGQKEMLTYQEGRERPSQLLYWGQLPRTMKQVCQAAVDFFYFLITALLKYNVHTLQVTYIECTIQWVLVYSRNHNHNRFYFQHPPLQKKSLGP